MYENGALSLATGGPLHPGEWMITERMLTLCKLCAGSRVLDIGCGDGSTLEFLLESAAINAIGLDRSENMLHRGRERAPGLPLTCALGTALPIASEQVDAVLAECSLSAIAEIEIVLAEVWRVLRPGGWLAISDIYVRDPAGDAFLRALPVNCGLRDAVGQPELFRHLQEHDFEIQLFEDHSEVIKELTRQIVTSHGSISAFWKQSEPEADLFEIVHAISKTKLGYFVAIAKKRLAIKGDDSNG